MSCSSRAFALARSFTVGRAGWLFPRGALRFANAATLLAGLLAGLAAAAETDSPPPAPAEAPKGGQPFFEIGAAEAKVGESGVSVNLTYHGNGSTPASGELQFTFDIGTFDAFESCFSRIGGSVVGTHSVSCTVNNFTGIVTVGFESLNIPALGIGGSHALGSIVFNVSKFASTGPRNLQELSVSFEDNNGASITPGPTIEGSIEILPNEVPFLNQNIPDQTVSAGIPASIDLSNFFSDPEDDPLTFSATGLPPSGSLTLDAMTGLLSGTPVGDDLAGSPYTVEVTADDDIAGSVSDTFLLNVDGGPEMALSRDGGGVADGGSDDIGGRPDGTVELSYTITNTGTLDLTVQAPVASGLSNVSAFSVVSPPAASVAPGADTTFGIRFDVDSIAPFQLDLSVATNDAEATPYTWRISGDVPLVDLSAVLPQPTVLVDNDGDGKPNPSDTLTYGVTLRNDGASSESPVSFMLTVPAGTTITRVNRSGLVPGTLQPNDGTNIVATFDSIDGGGSEFQNLITFDLLIDNDTIATRFELQGMFSFGSAAVLTDDPSTPGSEEPTPVEVGLLNRILADQTSMNFGQATALSDNFVAVGSPGDDGGAGAVNIYRIVANGQRVFVERITPPADFDGMAFGSALAIDDNMLVVGSGDNASVPKGATGNKVAVYSLQDSGSSLVDQIRFNLSSEFGAAVDIDGDAVIVGAPGDDGDGVTDAGAVYTYSLSALNSGDPDPQMRVAPTTPESQARFGAAVACAGGKIVVGSPGPLGMALAGRAAIVDAVSGALTDIGTPFDGAGEFGAAVAIENGKVIIGAPAVSSGGGVFEYDTNGNRIGDRVTGSDTASGNEFGRAVALDGGDLYVGAPNAFSEGLSADGNFGAVYRFSAAQRQQMEKIGAFSESSETFEQQDAFGAALAARRQALVVGAPASQNARGAAAFRRGEAADIVFEDGFE